MTCVCVPWDIVPWDIVTVIIPFTESVQGDFPKVGGWDNPKNIKVYLRKIRLRTYLEKHSLLLLPVINNL